MPSLSPVVLISVALLLTAGSWAHAQEQLTTPKKLLHQDSTKTGRQTADSTRSAVKRADRVAQGHPDSTGATSSPDTLGRMSTPSLVGTLDRSLDSNIVLTKDELHWLDYRSLGGILESLPGAYLRTQNSVGQYDQINFRGSDWRGIAVFENGRLLNDPASGVYNLFNFTTEYADRIEVITGPRAFLYGLNSTGGAVNLVTKNYNSNRPFTKINYTETAYDDEYSDGTFSQNISRKLNFTFGFQHQGTTGRFPNSAHEAWNIRSKIRYNLSNQINVILSEYFTSTETDLNGGVDTLSAQTRNAFDPLRVSMRDVDSYEKTTRHDLSLSLIGTLLDDTANVSDLTFYYSHNLREYRDEENRPTPNGIFIQSDHTSSWLGAHATQNIITAFSRINLGANLELRQVEGSPNLGRRRNVIGSVWAQDDLSFGEDVILSGFGRYDRYLGKDYAGVGMDATLKLSRGLSFFAGLSVSRRLPNYQELYWTDSTVTRTDPITAERHRQAEAGFSLIIPDRGSMRLAYFHRTVDDAIRLLPYNRGSVFPGIIFSNDGTIATSGLEATATLRIWLLTVEGTGTVLTQQKRGGSGADLYPGVWGSGGIYFWNSILDDHLDLKVGFKGRYSAAQGGVEFNPQVVGYVTGTNQSIGRGGLVDFLLIARVGDAYVHLTWENLTNVQYFSTPYFPVLDRAVRFGISWEFLN